MEPSLDPEIAEWLAFAQLLGDVFGELSGANTADPYDVAAVRDVVTRYTEAGHQHASSWADFRAVTVGGVEALQCDPVGGQPVGTVVALHGGGFITGDPRGAAPVAALLARDHRVRTVAVRYRLAPEHPYPAAVEDAAAVMRELAADPEALPIAVWGDSAGAAVAICAVDMVGPLGVRPRGLALVCPAVDDAPAGDVWSPALQPRERAAMWHHYLGPQSVRREDAVPARWSPRRLARLPSTMIVVAEHDVLRAEGIALAERLASAGVDVVAHEVPGTVHGFTGLMADTAVGRRWNATIAAWLAGSLAP